MANRRQLLYTSGTAIAAWLAHPGAAAEAAGTSAGGRFILSLPPEGSAGGIVVAQVLGAGLPDQRARRARYRVDWGDGRVWDGELPIFGNVYHQAGTYTVRVSARLGGRVLRASRQITIHSEHDPGADAADWDALDAVVTGLPVRPTTGSLLQQLGRAAREDYETSSRVQAAGSGRAPFHRGGAAHGLRAMREVLDGAVDRGELEQPAAAAFLFGFHLPAMLTLTRLHSLDRRTLYRDSCYSFTEEYLPYVLYYLEQGMDPEWIADLFGTAGFNRALFVFLINTVVRLIHQLREQGLTPEQIQTEVHRTLLEICNTLP